MIGLVLRSAIAALAVPVTGYVVGKVVGDYVTQIHAPWSWVGAALGIAVYGFTLAASYQHLREFYRGFEPPHLKASRTLSASIEVATFYMSVSSVLTASTWAFWGSMVGAFIVFWGNWQSMLRSAAESRMARRAPRRVRDVDPWPAEVGRNGVPHERVLR